MRTLLLTTMLILAACSSRQPYPPKSADEIDQLIRIADEAFDVAQKAFAGAPEMDVQEATRKMRAALDAARAQTDEILRQVANVDHLAKGTKDPMGVSSCITSHRLEMDDIENMSPNTKISWSMDVGRCAAFTIVYFKTTPPADSGVLALALTIIDPVMLVAKARSHLKQGALAHYRDSNESIIAKLGPECEKTGKASEAGKVSYQCAAYQVAIAVRPKLQTLAQQVQITP